MKQLIGKDIGSYEFDAANGVVKLIDVVVSLEQVLIITNVTSQTMIYCFNSTLLGGSLSGNSLTLDYDTSAMSNTDILQIYVDIPEELVVERTEGNSTTELLTLIFNEIKLQNILICMMNAGDCFTIEDMEDIKNDLINKGD